MPVACDLYQPFPGLFFWQYYDTKIKAELCSSAIVASGKIYLVDPILLEASQFDRLRQKAPPAGIIVTNANHVRDSLAYSDRFSTSIFASQSSFPDPKPTRFVQATNPINNELEVIEIEGAVLGLLAST